MTIWREVVACTRRRLGDDVAARWICAAASGSDDLHAIGGEAARPPLIAEVEAMAARVEAGEPVAYVVGRAGFRHLDLYVDRRVLIPRPETELVAAAAIECAAPRSRPVIVADLGTGSGAIGLSLAAELPIDGTTVWLADADADALAVARANLAGLDGQRAANVRIAEPGSWFDVLPADVRFDVVVANPPYVADQSPDVEPQVAAWEPQRALFSGPDGLDDLRAIIAAAPGHLATDGWLVVEIGYDQGDAVGALLTAAGFGTVEIRRDLTGHDRIAIAGL